VVRLATLNTARPLWLRFSPDARTIRFTVLDRAVNRPNLGNGRRLEPACVPPSPVGTTLRRNVRLLDADGAYFVFQSTRHGFLASIWAMREKRALGRKDLPRAGAVEPLDR